MTVIGDASQSELTEALEVLDRTLQCLKAFVRFYGADDADAECICAAEQLYRKLERSLPGEAVANAPEYSTGESHFANDHLFATVWFCEEWRIEDAFGEAIQGWQIVDAETADSDPLAPYSVRFQHEGVVMGATEALHAALCQQAGESLCHQLAQRGFHPVQFSVDFDSSESYIIELE